MLSIFHKKNLGSNLPGSLSCGLLASPALEFLFGLKLAFAPHNLQIGTACAFMIFLTASDLSRLSNVTVVSAQLMTKNMLSCNRIGLFTSRIESKHLGSRVVSNVSFHFNCRVSGYLIMGVKQVKHLDSNNIIPLGESNCWTLSL